MTSVMTTHLQVLLGGTKRIASRFNWCKMSVNKRTDKQNISTLTIKLAKIKILTFEVPLNSVVDRCDAIAIVRKAATKGRWCSLLFLLIDTLDTDT